jgi:hypothetical protein
MAASPARFDVKGGSAARRLADGYLRVWSGGTDKASPGVRPVMTWHSHQVTLKITGDKSAKIKRLIIFKRMRG